MSTELQYPSVPFHALLTRAAELWPEKTALIFRDQRLTFSDLDRAANRIARGCIAAGLQPGDRVALFLPNCPEYETIFFGASRAGGVPTPLNPSYREREIRHQLTDSGARFLFVHQSLYPVAQPALESLSAPIQVLVVGDGGTRGMRTLRELEAGQPDIPPPISRNQEDMAALPYSSGTTGLSKGVMLTNLNMVSNAFQFVDSTRTTEQDVLLIFLPLYHIYGVALVATAVAAGATQVLLERFDLSEVLRLLDQERVTELYVVPPVMLGLANAPSLSPEQFRHVRFIMSAAAPLSPEIARRVSERLQVRVIQAYGLTETSPLTHMVRPDWDEPGFETVGRVALGTECRIVDIERGTHILPPGEVGEVVVRGPQIMAGYWMAPEETAATLRQDWLHTGDIGKMDDQGNLYIVDRKKEMIKYKAFTIAPAELEAVLLDHPAVVDCGVTSRPDAEAGEIPVAFVVLRPGEQVTPLELQDFVRDRVAHYKQIRELHIVESIPHTPSGKILRRVLKKQAAAEE